MFAVIRSLLWREMTLAIRRRAEVLTTLFFFVIVVSLFPLGVGPEIETLREIAPGVLWVAALLASMLSLNRLFADDYMDGTLEQMLLASQPLSILVLTKILSHWLLTGLPLVLISPVLGMQLGLDMESLLIMVVTLLLGTPVLSLIGAVGAGLTLGVRGGGVLLALLILPLYVPVLIFGSGAVEAARTGMEIQAHLSLLGIFLVLALVLAPIGAAKALKIALD
ncbi:MAG: heme exporter protein CcmB [Candidatus Heimdallarchaeota archaeon]|nr:heme exporter protein CcmB [Candidatus Heimdallarchaeota archaeon]